MRTLELGEPPFEILVRVAAMFSNEEHLVEKQFQVNGKCLGGSWGDAEGRFSEELEDERRLKSSDVVPVNELPNVFDAEVRGGAIEEELKELAEEGIERLVLGSEGEKMRPTTSEKVLDLAAEGDVVFDELVPGAQELAQRDDLRRR